MILDFRNSVAQTKVSYTLSWAKGTSSYAEDVYSRYYRENPDTSIIPPATEYNLDFDQRHRIFVQGLINMPWKTRVYILGYFGAGFPYTPPGPEGKLEERNILRLPFQKQIDCVFLRSFPIGKFTIEANLEIVNLLNVRNQIAPLSPQIPEAMLRQENYHDYYSVFSDRYHPAADQNHDGLITPKEYYNAIVEINRESEDWVNSYMAPRRGRIGITINF